MTAEQRDDLAKWRNLGKPPEERKPLSGGLFCTQILVWPSVRMCWRRCEIGKRKCELCAPSLPSPAA